MSNYSFNVRNSGHFAVNSGDPYVLAQSLESFSAVTLISRQRLRDDSYRALLVCISALKQEQLHLTATWLRSSSDFHTGSQLTSKIRTLNGSHYGISASTKRLHPDKDNPEPCFVFSHNILSTWVRLTGRFFFFANTVLYDLSAFTCRERSFWRTSSISLWLLFLTTETWCVIRLLSVLILNTGLEFLQLQLELETRLNHQLFFLPCSTTDDLQHWGKVLRVRAKTRINKLHH